MWDAADGVLALNLARDDDQELLPAWTEGAATGLSDLAAVLRTRTVAPLVERARLLGLAAAVVAPPVKSDFWFHARRCAPPTTEPQRVPLVVDLSALWAGPLCGQLLASGGARVIKVEGERRPDGARHGPPALFDLLNAGKESVQVDFSSARGVAALKALLECADIVIEGTRPRALEQLGIIAGELVADRPGKVWLSITGYGREGPQRDWIAYGDDAAVAAGLSWLMGGDRGDPVFGGDAIADPLTGLHATLAALVAWRQGGGVVLDVALHKVMSWCLGLPMVPPAPGVALVAEPPVARAPSGRAAALGAHTGQVLEAWL